MSIATVDPATGETIETFTPLTEVEIRDRTALAFEAVALLNALSFDRRADGLRAAAELLEKDIDELAQTMTTEMGKTLKSARAEVLKCAKGLRFYADNAETMLQDEIADASAVGATEARHRFEPLGVVLAVMPWNYPLWQVVRFAAPALMVGNVGLLKHASNVPRTASYLGDLFARAGFPAGAFQTLLITSEQVEQVLRDDRVAAATLTGSEAAGRSVGRIAGEELKKVVLELGGSDPFLVLPSADLAAAARTAAVARCQNNGQSCIAAKRFIVHTDVFDEFAAHFVREMQALVVGNPNDDTTDIGPLATRQGREDVVELVADAVNKGATLLAGGVVPEGPGWFYPATIVTDIDKEMRLYAEETFGPVASLYRVDTIDDALSLANDSAFGLGSSVWTEDWSEIDRCVEELQAGQVFVNGMTASHPEISFGGIKTSGHGRELSRYGMLEFCNIKTVWIGATSMPRPAGD